MFNSQQYSCNLNLISSDEDISVILTLKNSVGWSLVRFSDYLIIFICSEQKSAVVEFRESGSADLFSRSHNRKMMDLAIITATRLM